MAKHISDTYTPETAPKWRGVEDTLTNFNHVGTVQKALKSSMSISNINAWNKIRAVAWSNNPKYGLPRLIVALLKLEEMALGGDMDAMKLYFDRVLGKQAEGLAIAVGQYDGLSDTDLLSQFAKVKAMKNVVQSPNEQQPDVNASENTPD